MLKWLNQHSGADLKWEDFLASDAVLLTGATFTTEEIIKQAKYLQERDIVFAMPGSDSPLPVLTAKGEDLTVRDGVDFTALPTKAGDTFNTHFHDAVKDTNVQVGPRNELTDNRQSAKGFDELAAAVRQIAELLPRLGLPALDEEDATEHASDVLAEATSERPDAGKIRRALSGLRRILVPVAEEAVSGAGEGAHELAKEALNQLQQLMF